jgi:phosphoglucosamine mutase
MLEAALMAGICSAGADVVSLGVVPTAGVAYLTRCLGATAGVMVSASHNPYEDNGIKFFSAAGDKLPDEIEAEIEAQYLAPAAGRQPVVGAAVGSIQPCLTSAPQQYIDFLKSTFHQQLPGRWRIGLDCAHGAASAIAPALFKQLGAEVHVWHATPDGMNINRDCGSLHPEFLQRQVIDRRLDVGFAFDGDADRLIAIDHTGRILDGDYVLAICAQALQSQAAMATGVIVSTVMANLGLTRTLQRLGLTLHTTQVGDRYVLQGMRQQGALLGGEQSGHIIFLQHQPTGDGLLTALQLLSAMVQQQVPLAELAQILQKFPQVLLNVRIRERCNPLEVMPVQRAVEQATQALGQEGRILVRLSGTEPVARVMVEGPDETVITALAQGIAQAIAHELG